VRRRLIQADEQRTVWLEAADSADGNTTERYMKNETLAAAIVRGRIRDSRRAGG
jgi:hypothetical protein